MTVCSKILYHAYKLSKLIFDRNVKTKIYILGNKI